MNLENLGRIIIYFALLLLVVGGLLILAGKGLGLRRFPGDILVRRDGFTLYFPLGASIAISIVLTVLLNFFLGRGR